MIFLENVIFLGTIFYTFPFLIDLSRKLFLKNSLGQKRVENWFIRYFLSSTEMSWKNIIRLLSEEDLYIFIYHEQGILSLPRGL